MKQIFVIICIMVSLKTFSQKNDLIYLWQGKVPGEVKEKQAAVIAPSENDNIIRYSEVTNPAMEVFLPDATKNNGSACVPDNQKQSGEMAYRPGKNRRDGILSRRQPERQGKHPFQ